jgi:hypothetical protein
VLYIRPVAAIPDAVRAQAVNPFGELDVPPDIEVHERDGFAVGIGRGEDAQVVTIVGDGPADVAAAVEEARSIARANAKPVLAWWIAPDHDSIGPALERLGLVNEDTPGFEAVENAMALVSPPDAAPAPDVEVTPIESFEDFAAGQAVIEQCFGLAKLSDEQIRDRYLHYSSPQNPGRAFLARIDGEPVGNAYAATGPAAVNLFGGSVVEPARGRGVYRSLTWARWEYAVERGTPALTVQAGRMSRPICERAGFEFLAEARVFVDKRA